MFRNYLFRFLDIKVPMRTKMAALKRYMVMLFSVIKERIAGYDYSMIYLSEADGKKFSGGYTKTPEYLVKRVFDDIPLLPSEIKFIDIGCGKGYVITRAVEFGMSIVGGVEYNDHLYDVCCSNLRRKGISTENIWHGNAKDFPEYGKYNLFFFNNPLVPEVLSDVAKNIMEAHVNDIIYLYYINVNSEEKKAAIEKAGFKFVKTLFDKNESYFDIQVYKNR